MKFTALVSLAAAVLAFTEASPIKVSTKHGHAVPLSRNPNYKHNTKAQINKMNARYGHRSGARILDGTTGTVPLTNVNHDVEYYGSVSVGSPAQVFKLDFDTGSSDIWFPSSTCNTSACKAHNRFAATKSSTYKKDGRSWKISYGDKSAASGILGSDIYLFGGIDSTKYSGELTYINVDQQGYWQIPMDDITYNGSSLGLSAEGIVDTGTTLVIIGTAAAQTVHNNIQGAVFTPATSTDPAYWAVPCSLQSSTDNVGFSLGGKIFNVPVADIAYEDLGDGSGNCYSGIQGGQDDLWILGDVFIKNNYCVFDQGATPRIGIAPLNY
ncbi:hypothetical protein BGX26_004315 [Mortierella sp. AD094]|nr:hypothetical protein BGX26_004315 [Mortierella sp. AD094]